tara:strand:- start:307 stop:1290 length:984 start_codon:yes stop_codon:yes gene_type:complete
MAFQDSCSTIVLDAILTDVGRKRMAQGDFRITKFSLGDDEVDYGLRSKTNQLYKNPRISALPVFEAFSNQNAVINYGLVDYVRPDVFYVPDLKSLGGYVDASLKKYNNYYYMAVNDETAAKLKTALSGTDYFLESDEVTKTKLVVGSGITNAATIGDKLSKERFLMNLGLYDSYYTTYCDSRFVENILLHQKHSYIKNDKAGNIYTSFGPLKPSTKVSLNSPVEYYDSYRTIGVDNQIFPRANGTGVLPHSGSRATVIALNFNIYNRLCGPSAAPTADEYYIFGKTNQAIFGGGYKYDYIDTTIYIEGLSSNARLQIPLRIVRYKGT